MKTISIFGKYAESRRLQAMIDNSLEILYGAAFWRKYLSWGLPQEKLTYATAIGRARIEAAASIVGPDDPAPLRSRGALELLEGSIPTMKEKFFLKQDEYRSIKSLQSLPISDEAKKEALLKLLWDDLTNAAKSTDRRIDIMFLEAISKLEITINVANNPDGVVYDTLDLLAKAYQKVGVAKVWTDPTADIFADIEKLVHDAKQRGHVFAKALITDTLWQSIRKNNTVKDALKGFYNPGSNARYLITFDAVNEYLAANRMPVFEIVDEVKGIEKDGVIHTTRPFKDENVSFIPSGQLGIVHNAVAIEEWEPVENVNYAMYDRALLSKWRENDPWREYTQVELSAFPGLEKIDGIYILKTDTIAA